MGSVRVFNEGTGYSDARLRELVDFVLERTGGIDGSLAIRFTGRGYGGGQASDRRQHDFPRWAGRARFAVHVSTAVRVDERDYPWAGICGHATIEPRTPTANLNAYRSGVRKIGRWPLYLIRSAEDWVLHTLAHELRHVVQFDRGRRSHSEVDCEEFAARVLDEWQACEVIAIPLE